MCAIYILKRILLALELNNLLTNFLSYITGTFVKKFMKLQKLKVRLNLNNNILNNKLMFILYRLRRFKR